MTEEQAYEYDEKCKGVKCNNTTYIIKEEHPHKQLVCAKCGKWADNIRLTRNSNTSRRTKNPQFRKRHEKNNGGLKCIWCGVTDKNIDKKYFEVHHIIKISEGGKDVFENTLMLCQYCHSAKGIEETRIKMLFKTKDIPVERDDLEIVIQDDLEIVIDDNDDLEIVIEDDEL